jgi:phosphonate transport system ATP-binding protein
LALDNCTVTITPGEFIIVIGPSGSGKSTLLRCVNRLVSPTSGQVIVDGTDVTAATREELRQARRAIGMIFQQFNLIKRASVMDNVLAGRLGYARPIASLFGYFGPDDQAITKESLQQVNMLELADRRADTLSGGQQQRVAIARALAQRPKVILADEPTASLDPKLTRVIMDILKEINRRQGITLMVSQHLIDVALTYGSRLIGLQSGRIVFDGPPQQLTETIIQQIYGEM